MAETVSENGFNVLASRCLGYGVDRILPNIGCRSIVAHKEVLEIPLKKREKIFQLDEQVYKNFKTN
jgi:hypothetical protein